MPYGVKIGSGNGFISWRHQAITDLSHYWLLYHQAPEGNFTKWYLILQSQKLAWKLLN